MEITQQMVSPFPLSHEYYMKMAHSAVIILQHRITHDSCSKKKSLDRCGHSRHSHKHWAGPKNRNLLFVLIPFGNGLLPQVMMENPYSSGHAEIPLIYNISLWESKKARGKQMGLRSNTIAARAVHTLQHKSDIEWTDIELAHTCLQTPPACNIWQESLPIGGHQQFGRNDRKLVNAAACCKLEISLGIHDNCEIEESIV